MVDITEDAIRDNAKASRIPDYMHNGLVRYIVHRDEPGGFLSAVLKNDLRAAIEKADSNNVNLLRNYVHFLYMYSPANCWGSPEKFERWLNPPKEKAE